MDAVTTYGWTRDNPTNDTGLETGTGDVTGSLNNVSGVSVVEQDRDLDHHPRESGGRRRARGQVDYLLPRPR